MRITVDGFEDSDALIGIIAKLVAHYIDELNLVKPRLTEIGLRENYFHVKLTPKRQTNSDTVTVVATFTIEHDGVMHELGLETRWGAKELQDFKRDWLYGEFNAAWCKYLLKAVKDRAHVPA